MSELYWTPAPPEDTGVFLRCHPLAPFRPRSLVPGDYVFFNQERVVLQPGEIKPLYLDADISTFGQVNLLEFPIAGYSWYHPAMSTVRCGATGYHRLFEIVKLWNCHDHEIIVEEGSAVCRVIMDSRNRDHEGFDGHPETPSVPLIAYRNYTTREAAERGPIYYTNANLAPCHPLDAPLSRIRAFTEGRDPNTLPTTPHPPGHRP